MGDDNRQQRHFHGNVLADQSRREEIHGREYLVAPVVPVVEMVLEYGNRKELLPAEELSRTVERQLWESRPLTVTHPQENGRWLGGGTVKARRKFGIGTLQNVRLDGRGRMKGEAWVDLEAAENVEGGAEVVEAIENEEVVEVSTGYWASFDASPGIHNATGERYDGVQRSLDPDHLAILTNAQGRCSVEDGCGLMRVNALSSARTPEFDGTSGGEVPDGWPPTFSDYVDAFFEGEEAPETVEDAPQDLKNEIAQTSLLGDPESDAFRDLRLFPVVDTNGNLQEGALDAVISGRGAQADVSESALQSARGIARTLLEEEFDRDLEDTENVENVTVLEAVRSLDGPKLKRALANAIGMGEGAELKADQEATIDTLRDALDDVVSDAFGGPKTFVFVEDVLLESQSVVWGVREEGKGKDLFRAPYTFDAESGEVEVDFTERQEVREVTTFEPVDNATGNSDDVPREDTMQLNDAQRSAIIAALVACEACNYENEDQLAPLADGDLVAIARNRELEIEDVSLEDVAAEGGDGEGEGGTDPSASASGEDGSTKPEGGDGGGEDEPDEDGVTLSRDEYDQLQNLLDRSKDEQERREQDKKELAGRLVRRDNCAWSREELEAKPLEELERIDAATRERTFGARPGPRGNAGGDEEEESYHAHQARDGVFQVFGDRAKRINEGEDD